MISLDVSSNTSLSELSCSFNNLTDIDVSSLIDMTVLDCKYNHLSYLDLSNNIDLTELKCNNNQLTFLDIRNGNNQFITWFQSNDNPDLTCIYVDDKDANFLNGWIKDPTSHFINNEEECNAVSWIEYLSENDFTIYPNPTIDLFNIQSDHIVETVEIYNISGQLVKTFNAQKQYFVSGLRKGFYIVNINGSEFKYSKSLIIK